MSKKEIIKTTIFDENLVDSRTFLDNYGYAQRTDVEIKVGDTVHHGMGQHGDGTIYKIIRRGKEVHTAV